MIKVNAEGMGNVKICGDCAYFRQHYVLQNGMYFSTFCGHCVFPNIKHRETFTKACKHYQGKIVRF